MNILMAVFLSLAAHGPAACSQFSANSTEIQMVAASRLGHNLVESGVNGTHHGTTRYVAADATDDASADDLLFYVSSHALAVGDTPGPILTPWLELRPIGDVVQGGTPTAGDPASQPHGKGASACSWSAAGAPASEQSDAASGV